MRVGRPFLFDFLGFSAQGDIGPYTCYQSKRRKLVVYAKAPPKEPPSNKQIYQRNVWRAAALLWRSVPANTRMAWNSAAHAAHLCISGHNLFIFYYTTGRTDILRTIERQTGLALL